MDDFLNQQYPAGLLSTLGINPEDLRRQQQQAGLLSAGLQLLAGSGYSPVRQSTGQLLGQAGMAGVQGMQQAGESAIQRNIQGLQVGDIARRQKEAELIRTLGPQLFTTQDGKQVINQDIANRLMTSPAGMDYLKNATEARRNLMGKTEVVEIFSPTGQPMKVRYNVDTGEYTPLGGTKAEPFSAIDLGNVVELRTPSGTVIGRLPKGAAPTAPSFTMTETGQILNTKTGQLRTPTDEQGNPIIIDQSAKATEGERLSSGFYARMADSTNTLSKPLTGPDGKPVLRNGKPVILDQVASKPEMFAEIVGGLVPNWLGGEELQNAATTSLRQQYEQAQRNWITANLRKESGANIPDPELKNEIKKWFPVVGDSEAVIEQKRKARKVAEESMRKNAGRALVTQPTQRNVTVDY